MNFHILVNGCTDFKQQCLQLGTMTDIVVHTTAFRYMEQSEGI